MTPDDGEYLKSDVNVGHVSRSVMDIEDSRRTERGKINAVKTGTKPDGISILNNDSPSDLDKLQLIATIVNSNRLHSQALLIVDGQTMVRRQINEEIITGVILKDVGQQMVTVIVGNELAHIKLGNSNITRELTPLGIELVDGKQVEIGHAPTTEGNATEYDKNQNWLDANIDDQGRKLLLGQKPGKIIPQELEHNEFKEIADIPDPYLQSIIGKPAIPDSYILENSPTTPFDE